MTKAHEPVYCANNCTLHEGHTGECRGVAAPLEPTVQQFIDEFTKDCEGLTEVDKVLMAEIAKGWAAAVSKNIQEELAETKATLRRWENAWMQDETIGRTNGKPDGTVRPSLAKTIERADRAESRITQLEKELAELRKK